jgi:8-oxo-dGTP pyrophosphatase MutT (NUDIX family)
LKAALQRQKYMKKCLYKLAFWPRRLYWFIVRPKTQGVKCIICKDNEILYIKNTYGSGLWNFPGGGIKRKEAPEQAVKREAREELGIELIGLNEAGSFINKLEYKTDTVFVFTASISPHSTLKQSAEIEEYMWLDKTTLPEQSSNTVMRCHRVHVANQLKTLQ